MTLNEAKSIFRMLSRDNLSDEDFFLYTEAGEFIIEATGDPRYMMELGGAYYDRRNFDLALHYYEMAARAGFEPANTALGYIWYYGRTGKTDYEKAFRYFSACPGSINARYKIADMYRNGYYVPRDEQKYISIIETLYALVSQDTCPEDLQPEIFTRLARIRINQGKKEEALSLLRQAKKRLALRISENQFFGNLSIMKHLILDMYSLTRVNEGEIDLFDLYEILRRPSRVSFRYAGRQHTVQSVAEDGRVVIQFDGGKWYRTTDDFFERAAIGDVHLTEICLELTDFEVTAHGE